MNKPHFEQLQRVTQDDLSVTWEAYSDVGGFMGEGSTPSEAVANLYLALNEKK
jgi:hypothetical protein